MFVEKFAAIPEIAQLGPLFKSSQPAELTESETEYVVHCIKHVFAGHLVLQFDCTNTLNDQLLEGVTVHLELCEGIFNFTDFFLEKNISEIYIYFLKGYTLDQILPCPRLEYNVAGTIYVILETPTDMSDWVGTISPTLKFVVCILISRNFFLVNIE